MLVGTNKHHGMYTYMDLLVGKVARAHQYLERGLLSDGGEYMMQCMYIRR